MAFLLDASGSISLDGSINTPEQVRTFVSNLGEVLERGIMVYIVQFSGQRQPGYTVDDHATILAADDGTQGLTTEAMISEAMAKYTVGGETDVISGLKKAKEVLNGVGMIVLVTDVRAARQR